MKKAFALFLALLLTLFLLPAQAAETTSFTDVPENAWYAPYVEVCLDAGLMQGTGGGRFEPERRVTAGEALVVAARIYDKLHGGTGALPAGPSPEEFLPELADDPESLAYANSLYPSAVWDAGCYLNDLLTDQEVYFDHYLTEPCYRRELFWLLSAVLTDTALPQINTITALPDTQDERILGLYRAGITQGVDKYGTYAGEGFLTRAELAATAARVLVPSLRLTFTPVSLEGNYTLAPIDLGGYHFMSAEYRYYRWGSSAQYATAASQQYILYGERAADTRRDWDDPLLWGVMTADGKAITKPIYTVIGEFGPDGAALVGRDGKYGFIDTQGREIVPCAYDRAAPVHDGVLLLCRDNGSDFPYDDLSNGRALSQCRSASLADYATFRADGTPIAVFRADGRVIDVVAGGYTEGLAAYALDGACGYLDEYGNTVIAPKYYDALPFSEGHAVVYNGERQPTGWNDDTAPVVGVVDAKGNMTVPFGDYLGYGSMYEVYGFHCGLLSVSKTGATEPVYGAIDPQGKVAIPFDYSYLGAFSEGIADYHKGSLRGVVTASGMASPLPFYIVEPYSEGYAAFDPSDGYFGYLDRTGTPVVPARFRYAGPIYQGRAIVEADGGLYLLTLKEAAA